MKNLFNIEHNERVKFKRHFIRSVIVDIAFSSLSKNIILTNEEYFKSEFKKLGFDNSGQIKFVEFKMNIEDEKPQKLTNEENTAGLLFKNSGKMKDIELKENSLICVDNQYESFEFFVENIEKIISIIDKVALENNAITKIGFRKINSFLSTETKDFNTITELFNPAIFAPLRTNLLDISNFKTHTETIVAENEQCKSRLIFACTKTNTDEFQINLDIDLIDSKIYDRLNLIEKINSLNTVAYDLFIWSTTDKFRNIMNKIED